jgi:hypothetical protein
MSGAKKNAVRVALIRSDVSEEGIASIFRVTRIGELRTTLTATLSSEGLFLQDSHPRRPHSLCLFFIKLMHKGK